MASPQKEHGYTAIANELTEAFMRLNLSPHEWRIVFCVIRYSYGWNKKTAHLTCSQFSVLTGIDIRLIPRIIRRLLSKKVISREGKSFRLQKDYTQWRSSVRMSSGQMINIISTDDKPSSVQMMTMPIKSNNGKGLHGSKDIFKDNIKKSLYRERLLERLKTLFPDGRIPGHITNKQIDYFLFRVEKGLDYRKVQDPVRYIKSLIVDEDFPPLLAREEIAKEKEAKRIAESKKQREEFESFRKETTEEMQKKIKTFISKIAGKGMGN